MGFVTLNRLRGWIWYSYTTLQMLADNAALATMIRRSLSDSMQIPDGTLISGMTQEWLR